ncbi:MAG: hypothetical protein HY880_00375, partial [Deltaproteobacteria bacterium]|nr:hypothetical protein [Deltaproteobacteria bacterium]
MSGDDKRQKFNEAKAAISWYEMADMENELAVNDLSPFFRRHVCHFLYGENSMYHIKKSRSDRKKIFVTFHQPPSLHREFVRTRGPLENIDGIIVVGTNQIPFFSEYADRSRIFFVPHGIDTDFFRPVEWIRRDLKTCLFVGTWQRDFETFNRVAEILGRVDKDIIIDVDVVDL